jgi:hypothetical protein
VSPTTGLTIGYVWKTADYPWFSSWRSSEGNAPVSADLPFHFKCICALKACMYFVLCGRVSSVCFVDWSALLQIAQGARGLEFGTTGVHQPFPELAKMRKPHNRIRHDYNS